MQNVTSGSGKTNSYLQHCTEQMEQFFSSAIDLTCEGICSAEVLVLPDELLHGLLDEGVGHGALVPLDHLHQQAHRPPVQEAVLRILIH